MLSFVQRHREQVTGVLSGFDRLRFRGTLRVLAHVGGMMDYLWHQQVPLTRFKDYVCETTKRLREATEAFAQRAGRRVRYVASSTLRKEDLVRQMAAEEGLDEGLLAVLSCVEPCRSYELHRNRETKHLDLRNSQLKCLHYYFYFQHPQLGFLHARLQTWFPFTMHVCLNGREWLARQMDRAGIDYLRQDNCFVELADVARAQRLLDRQLKTDWPRLLDRIARQVFPLLPKILGDYPVPYYWSADQSEWATDVMFRSRAALAALYPRLVLHGMTHLGTNDVLRFLGRKTSASGSFGRLTAEVQSDLRQRVEGTRLKHFVNQNSIKMYDKQGRVLRIETTINSPREMKTYRPKEGDEGGPKSWRYLRKGVADMSRRAEISQAANERYLESLATVDETTPLEQLAKPRLSSRHLERPTRPGAEPVGQGGCGLAASSQSGGVSVAWVSQSRSGELAVLVAAGASRGATPPLRGRHTQAQVAARSSTDQKGSAHAPLPINRARPHHHHGPARRTTSQYIPTT